MTKTEEDYAILSRILEPFFGESPQLDRSYISPIKRGTHIEDSPSFRVNEYKERLYWRDWGLADQVGNRPEHLLMHLHNITFEEAEKMIETLDLPEVTEIRKHKRERLRIEDRPNLTKSELAYWKDYHVSYDTLKLFNVYGVDNLWCGRSNLYSYKANTPAFSYRGGKNLECFQYYCPNPKKFWRQGSFILGWDQLEITADELIICSGLKDGLCLFEASGLNFIAPSGEGSTGAVENVLSVLKRRFKRIYTLMDSDIQGKKATIKWKEKLDIDPFPLQFIDGQKDIADMSKKMGIEWLSIRINQAKEKI